MDAATLFKIVNSIALLAWIPMLVAPKWKWTKWWVTQKPVIGLLALAYLSLFIYLIVNMPADGPAMDFSSLAGVKALFQSDQAVLVGWIHYLAFDLMAGCYIFEQAQKRKIPHLLVVPALIFTFMLGPVGWLIYLLIKQFYPQRAQIQD
jgi:uncharacterized membrane protein